MGMTSIRFRMAEAEVFAPDGTAPDEALARTTHLAVGAHPDDVEIIGIDGILQCFRRDNKWFTAIVVTDGAGAPRAGEYHGASGEKMRRARAIEQRQAASMGDYGAVILLAYPSDVIKDPHDPGAVDDLCALLTEASPEVVYTHNLADKHDTHIGVTLDVINAIRRIDSSRRPKKLYGCEVWRDLDWLSDADKVLFDCSGHEQLQRRLLETFESQTGGKRFDLAVMGRRQANATYYESHEVDKTTGLAFATDLTSLIENDSVNPASYIETFMDRFRQDVQDRLKRLTRLP